MSEVTITETLASGLTYRASSAKYLIDGANWQIVPGGGASFPLQGSGFTLQNIQLQRFGEIFVKYIVNVNNATDLPTDFAGILIDEGRVVSGQIEENFRHRIAVTTGCEPSTMPTITPRPTPWPTKYHSDFPSVLPSRVPSDQPSYHPSSSPSNAPSVRPSSVPSRHTSVPSGVPSQLPSMIPTNMPSEEPSLTHSELPSSKPSSAPSESLSVEPTVSISRVVDKLGYMQTCLWMRYASVELILSHDFCFFAFTKSLADVCRIYRAMFRAKVPKLDHQLCLVLAQVPHLLRGHPSSQVEARRVLLHQYPP